MTAATTDRDPQFADADYGWYNTASGQTIYMGCMVSINASGLAVAATDSSAVVFAGVSCTPATSSGTNVATAGTIYPEGSGSVKVRRTGTALFNFSGTATLADIGSTVYVADDQTVGASANVSNYQPVGVIVEVPSSTTVRVDFTGFTKWNALSTATYKM